MEATSSQGEATTVATVAEAAKAAGVTRQAIEKRIKAGQLNSQRIVRAGRALLAVRLEEVLELYRREQPSGAPVATPVAAEELARERELRVRAETRAEAAEAQVGELSRAVAEVRMDAQEQEKHLRTLAMQLGYEQGAAQLPAATVANARSARPWVAAAAVGALVLAAMGVRSEIRARDASSGAQAAERAADALRAELATSRATVATVQGREVAAVAEARGVAQEAAQAREALRELRGGLARERAAQGLRGALRSLSAGL